MTPPARLPRRRCYDGVVRAVSGEVPGAVPGIRSPDTVKRVARAGSRRRSPATSWSWRRRRRRSTRTALRDAHERAATEGWEATDDAMLLERAGLPVAVVPGEDD